MGVGNVGQVGARLPQQRATKLFLMGIMEGILEGETEKSLNEINPYSHRKTNLIINKMFLFLSFSIGLIIIVARKNHC